MVTNSVYRGSDGRYYGDVDIWERLESGAWRPCCWDTESGDEWMGTSEGDLLALSPVAWETLPLRVRTERVEDGVSVVARRRVLME